MLALLILGPILVGVINIMFHAKDSRLFILISQIMINVAALLFFIEVKLNGEIVNHLSQISKNYSITLLGDAISIVFVALTATLFTFIFIYSWTEEYFSTQFGFLFLVLESLIIALFLSTDLFNLFVLLEVSTVVVSILIMYNKEKQAIYDGMIYFFANVIGSSFLLFGIAFLYKTFGLLDMRALEDNMALVTNPQTLILPFAFMMTTLSLKTAVIPLFSWLPKAHGTPSAPPAVSAVLSGLYIKTGVYMFIRFSTMYAPAIEATRLFLVIGIMTSIVGFILAIGQHDIKLILAYSTVSQIGLIMIGLNLGSEEAFWGSLYHMFNHSLFKTMLFLAAGIVYHYYGTRDLRQIEGVFKKLPLTGIAIALGILGVTGAPLFNGSISKYMIGHGSDLESMKYILNIINLGTIVYFFKLAKILFGSKETSGNSKLNYTSQHFIPQLVILGMGILVFLTGIFGPQTLSLLFDYTVEINVTEYIEKAVIYALMIIAAIGFNNGIIRTSGVFDRIGQLEFTFNGIITALTGYFIFLVGFLTLFL